MSASVNLLPREYGEKRRARRFAQGTALVVALWVVGLGAFYVVEQNQTAQARAERDAAEESVAEANRRIAQLEPYEKLADRVEARNTLLAFAMRREISWARVLNDLSLKFPRNASMVSLSAHSADEPPAFAEAVKAAARDDRKLSAEVGEAVPASNEVTDAVDGAADGAAPEPPPSTPETAPSDPPDGPDGEGSGVLETPPAPPPEVATVTFSGYSVERYAPGVESVLLEFTDASGFFDTFLQTAAESDRANTEVTEFDGSVMLDADAYTGRYLRGLPAEAGGSGAAGAGPGTQDPGTRGPGTDADAADDPLGSDTGADSGGTAPDAGNPSPSVGDSPAPLEGAEGSQS